MATPTNTYVHPGLTIDYTPGSAVAEGDVVVLSGATAGKIIGVATEAIAANALGQLAVAGVFSLKSKSADTFAAGEKLYWDGTNKECTVTSASNTLIGNAVEAKASGTTVCKVRLLYSGI